MASIGELAPDGTILSLENLCGRKTDMIFRTNGEPIDLFNSIPAEIFNNPDLRQWQFIQTDEKNYLLRLSLDRDCKNVVEIAERDLKILLGADAVITVECVNEIPVLSSGKRRVVINEWRK